jgi:hypothetical protein
MSDNELNNESKKEPTLKSSLDDDKPSHSSEPREIVDEDGKKVLVFHDPLHSRERRSVVNYTTFRGKWEFENLDNIDESDSQKCAVKFIPIKDASAVTIAFKSLKDRLEFMNSIYTDNEMKQLGGGMNLEKFANSKILRATGGIIGLSIVGYGLYKLLSGKKEE